MVASIDGAKAKVRFEDKVLDPTTGAVSRVDTAIMLFPVSALANDPDASAPAPAAAEAPEETGAAGKTTMVIRTVTGTKFCVTGVSNDRVAHLKAQLEQQQVWLTTT